ncbi:hypothetical protein AAC387_Pa04g1768 [Persea americana]
MTGREGAVPYMWMAVVRFGVEGKRGVSGREQASPQGSDDAILPILQQGCPPKSAIASGPCGKGSIPEGESR